jgi:uncharacterized protein (DUF3820 family)
MPFGKHRGKEIHTLPESYLRWMVNNLTFYGNENVLEEIREALACADDGADDSWAPHYAAFHSDIGDK